MHEDYNGGHLIEAAVAYAEATGKKKLLDVAIRFADHFDSLLGPGKASPCSENVRKNGIWGPGPGHEQALVLSKELDIGVRWPPGKPNLFAKSASILCYFSTTVIFCSS